jgi:hypothetical protein
MIRSKRIPVVFSIVGYLLATTAVHALHDHSAHAHPSLACSGEAAEDRDEVFVFSPHSPDGEGEHSHHHPFGPTSCDDSCFACRLLAVKCVAAAPLVVVPSIAVVCPIAQPARSFFPFQRPTQPLSRGPPCS